ncbi:hypothetical protein BDF14DRAFT_1742571 [Spinellus fusiger]|nr:hypothetical protein BDF14DRAFT_1742571 [Spinellus fusiger]
MRSTKRTLPTRLKPSESHSSPIPHEYSRTTDTSQVLEGVVACLDVRTEDGDDVSQNFERFLLSMGAKTRRTFSGVDEKEEDCPRKTFVWNDLRDLYWQGRRDGSPWSLAECVKKRGKKGRRETYALVESPEEDIDDTFTLKDMDTYPTLMDELHQRKDTVETTSLEQIEEEEEQEEQEEQEVASAAAAAAAAAAAEEDEEKERREKGKEREREREMPTLTVDPEVERVRNEREQAIKAQIKAEFFVEEIPSPKPARTSLSSVGPLRRKRRSLGARLSMGQPILSDLKMKPRIVFTNVSEQKKKEMGAIIQRLGRFEVDQSVSEYTTHVIGEKRRTESVTLGIAFHAWLLTPSWLMECGERGYYIEEDTYEATVFFPRARASRLGEPLFPSHLYVFIVALQVISRSLAEKLILLGGAKIASNREEADILVSTRTIACAQEVVSENWLLECIEKWQYVK